MEAPSPRFPSEIIWFPTSERVGAFSPRSRFCIDVGADKAPFWCPFGIKMEENSMPNPHQKTIDFSIASLIAFSTIVVAKRDEYLTPRRPQSREKSILELRLGPLGSILGLLYPFWGPIDRFGFHFGSFLVHFATILGGLGVQFWPQYRILSAFYCIL